MKPTRSNSLRQVQTRPCCTVSLFQHAITQRRSSGLHTIAFNYSALWIRQKGFSLRWIILIHKIQQGKGKGTAGDSRARKTAEIDGSM